MKVLITIPHIFSPKENSVYSSERKDKREVKLKGLYEATIGNLCRHNVHHWVHASEGKDGKVFTKRESNNMGVEMKIQVYTNKLESLTDSLPEHKNLTIIHAEKTKKENIPALASKRLLEQSEKYDLIGYMEDDIAIEDIDFFHKLNCIYKSIPDEYVLMPHRHEMIRGKGEVILSGDPVNRRSDLFWDTGEKIRINWPTGYKDFYRATNPHSGCYFITRSQAQKVLQYWQKLNWKSPYQLSGPLEQAASGMLIGTMKIMKPVTENYKFLMVRHMDTLWKRHGFKDYGEEYLQD